MSLFDRYMSVVNGKKPSEIGIYGDISVLGHVLSGTDQYEIVNRIFNLIYKSHLRESKKMWENELKKKLSNPDIVGASISQVSSKRYTIDFTVNHVTGKEDTRRLSSMYVFDLPLSMEGDFPARQGNQIFGIRKKDGSLDVKLLGTYKELKDRLQKLEEESGYPILGEFWCADFETYSGRD